MANHDKSKNDKRSKKHTGKKYAVSPAGMTLSEQLRLPQGPVDISALDPAATTGFPGKGKEDAPELTALMEPKLADLQERLYADGKNPETAKQRVLLLLQGMDTAGKGGTIKHVIGMVDPQGVQIKAFKRPTPEELAHDFLWRVRKAVPDYGMLGVFDRSQYEDVLIVRVDNLVPESEWSKRYQLINEFEAELAEQGTTLIKCFLNISKAVQKEREAARLADPAKYWKYNPGDLDTRAKWDEYMVAYADALEKCNTEFAPWYVIPSDRKWYRNWAVAQILTEHLAALNLQWPPATFDVETEKAKVAAC